MMVVQKARMLMTTISLMSIVGSTIPTLVHCNSQNRSSDGKDPSETDWLTSLATKGKEKLISAGLLKESDAKRISRYIHEYFTPSVVSQGSYGFIMGYSSGFFVKKASKVGAFVVGGVFVLLQVLSTYGYVDVNHNKLKTDMEKILDQNNDGKIDSKDFDIMVQKATDILSYNLPTGGGFAAGLIMGLRN